MGQIGDKIRQMLAEVEILETKQQPQTPVEMQVEMPVEPQTTREYQKVQPIPQMQTAQSPYPAQLESNTQQESQVSNLSMEELLKQNQALAAELAEVKTMNQNLIKRVPVTSDIPSIENTLAKAFGLIK